MKKQAGHHVRSMNGAHFTDIVSFSLIIATGLALQGCGWVSRTYYYRLFRDAEESTLTAKTGTSVTRAAPPTPSPGVSRVHLDAQGGDHQTQVAGDFQLENVVVGGSSIETSGTSNGYKVKGGIYGTPR